jgi:hypothetical protein
LLTREKGAPINKNLFIVFNDCYMKGIILFALLFFANALWAQHETETQHKYVAPTDPMVIKKIADWQDLKFVHALGNL